MCLLADFDEQCEWVFGQQCRRGVEAESPTVGRKQDVQLVLSVQNLARCGALDSVTRQLSNGVEVELSVRQQVSLQVGGEKETIFIKPANKNLS